MLVIALNSEIQEREISKTLISVRCPYGKRCEI